MPSSFRKNNFEIFIPCSYVQNCDPLGWGKFWAKGHHMNKLGKGVLGNATYQISKLHALHFQRRKVLKIGCFVPMFHLVTLRCRANFDPRGIIWKDLVKVHKEMLHTKYQSYTPFSFRESEFWSLLSLFLCYYFDPTGICSNLVEVHKDMPHTKYQSSRLPISEKNFDDRLLCPYVPTCAPPPGQDQFWPQGIIWTNLVKVHKEMLHTKCQKL